MARYTMFAAFTALAVTAPALASPVVAGFNNLGSLAPNDDAATGPVGLGFSANFFGTTYTNTYISNNGYFTFNSPQGTFTPTGLGTSYGGQPIIAAFFADVDTRGAGTLTYGTGTYNGKTAFGATWDAVGYYSNGRDKTNTFQIILTNRSDIAAGDFDIYYNYGQIQWETGSASGGSNGFGGVSAAVGYNAGSGNAPGTFFQQAGSLVNGALIDGGPNQLITATNDGTPGQLLFQVRAGTVIQPGVPEPATWALMLTGFGLVGTALRRKTAAIA